MCRPVSNTDYSPPTTAFFFIYYFYLISDLFLLEHDFQGYNDKLFFHYPLDIQVQTYFSGTKYRTGLMENTYKTKMNLTIVSVKSIDFGTYQCVSKNSLGDTDGTIKLYGMFFFRPEYNIK